MSFEEKDTTAPKEVTSKPVQVRFERNDAHAEGPPVDIYVVFDEDGHSVHRQVPREAVETHWDGTTKKLGAWIMAAIDLVG